MRYWQVQNLDGSPVENGDCLTWAEAQHVAWNLSRDFQRGFKIQEIRFPKPEKESKQNDKTQNH